MTPLRAPFPWFGGKSRAAHLVWEAFGDVANYVEPFAGSLAVLLGRPTAPRAETVNDKDAYLSNFWRAVQSAPEEVARWADWPVNEVDLHARHRWLVSQTDFRERMTQDPHHFDAKVAGWWVWGISQWIGSGWCSAGSWTEPELDGPLPPGRRVRGLSTTDGQKRRPSLGRGGNGVNGRGGWLQKPDLSGSRGATGRGVHAGVLEGGGGVLAWMEALADRLRRVRVLCGDWERVTTTAATTSIGVTGVLLDPPYLYSAGRAPSLYTHESATVARDVRAWALANGHNPKLRIALCGYDGEHPMPPSWRCVAWKASGGYAAAAGHHDNALRERIWLSPHCEAEHRPTLFDVLEARP